MIRQSHYCAECEYKFDCIHQLETHNQADSLALTSKSQECIVLIAWVPLQMTHFLGNLLHHHIVAKYLLAQITNRKIILRTKL